MTLEEMFEAAKAKWPTSRISVGRRLENDTESWHEWWSLHVDDHDPVVSRNQQELLAREFPDRIAKARQMIEEGNKILAEEGQPIPFAVLCSNSGSE